MHTHIRVGVHPCLCIIFGRKRKIGAEIEIDRRKMTLHNGFINLYLLRSRDVGKCKVTRTRISLNFRASDYRSILKVNKAQICHCLQ